MNTVVCPECEERVTLRTGHSSAKCPACGNMLKSDAATGRRGQREDADEGDKPKKKRSSRKYREEWDEDDDARPRRPVKKSGGLGWLWILLGVLALVLAVCGGAGYWIFTAVRKTRDEFAKDVERRQAEFDQRMNVQPGNPQGRPKPPPPQDSAFYPKKKPFEIDPQFAAKPNPVFVSDLSAFDVKQGSWPVGFSGVLGYDDRWVCVNGTYYDHGIGMIPPNNGLARASFAVGGQARRLTGQVALNDFWHDGDSWDTVTFVIRKDGKEVWRSKPMKKKKMPEAFDVDVTGARVVTLETDAPNSAHDAHCVWLDPVLLK